MFLSREEFLAQQAQRESNRQNFQSRPRVGFFSLKDDGDEAIVRFVYNDPSEFEIYTVHPVNKGGKFRKVNCINDLKKGIHSCPLCAAGVQLQQKFYIRLIEYVRDENGNITPQAKIWERPTSYMQRLINLATEYGNLSDCIFKIKRSGERGSMQTDYIFMFGNPSIYNEQLYPKDFSAFDGYTILGTVVLDESELELHATATEMGLEVPAVPTNQTFTPQSQAAPQTQQTDWSNQGAPRKPVQYN